MSETTLPAASVHEKVTVVLPRGKAVGALFVTVVVPTVSLQEAARNARTSAAEAGTAASDSTEVLPGTHHETAVTKWPAGERPQNHPHLLEKWGPAVAMEIPMGGICLRDPRMWHRGVPNLSELVRPMMALTYHSGRAKHWRGLVRRDLTEEMRLQCETDASLRQMDDDSLGDGRLVFQSTARRAFEAPQGDVERNVRFVEEPTVVNHFLDAHMLGGARVQQGGEPAPWLDP